MISPGCGLPRPGSDDEETGQTGGCYAMALAKRLKGMGSAKYQNDGDPRTSGPGFGVTVHPDTLGAPLRWRRPRTVFVNSMSDLGHARIPQGFVVEVFAVMAATPQHTYQILTKRPERMARMLSRPTFSGLVAFALERVASRHGLAMPEYAPWWPLPGVWLGTSIELDEYTRRADALRETPAAVRFISAEPLLGPLPSLDLTGIDWLITGGESGPNARPLDLGWVRDLRDRCVEAGVAYFHKQNGGRTAKSGGRLLDGRTWSEYPAERVAVAS